MATFAIRRATTLDIPAIVAVIERVFAEYGFLFDATAEVPDVLALTEHYDQAGGAFFAGVLDGVVVGSIGVERRAPGLAEIHRLYLNAACRGQGYGYRLLTAGVTWAREQGLPRIELWSDTRFTDAHRLYRRFGFRQAGERDLADVNHTREYGFVLES